MTNSNFFIKYDGGESVENDVRLALEKAKLNGVIVDYEDNVTSCLKPDFKVKFDPKSLPGFDELSSVDQSVITEIVSRGIFIEAKYRGYYNMENWGCFEELGVYSYRDAFIEDDLTIRRLDMWSGFFGLIVVGTDEGEIYTFQTSMLNRAFKTKLVNRPIYDKTQQKGKWLIPLCIGTKMKDMYSLIVGISKAIIPAAGSCGVLQSIPASLEIENISETGGIDRTMEHRQKDLETKK